MLQIGRSARTNSLHDAGHLDFCERPWIKGDRRRQVQKLPRDRHDETEWEGPAVIEDRRTGDTLTETGPRIRLEDQRQLERLAATTALALATARERKA